MIHSGRKTVAATGTPEALASDRTPASWLTIYAIHSNTGAVYIGDSNAQSETDAGAGLYTGIRITPGNQHTFIPTDGGLYINLKEVYVAVDTAADGVTYIYGSR